MRFVLLIVCVALVCSSVAHAQPFLEFSISSSGDPDGFGFPMQTHARLVVDAADPMQQVIASSGVYGIAVDTPKARAILITEMELSMTVDQLTIHFFGWYDGNFVILDLAADHAIPMDPDGSLQDNPNVYNAWNSMTCDSQFNLATINSSWNDTDGFLPAGSGFSLTVREVPDPNEEPACIADINGDGQLDFFDVSAYLQLFGLGCP